MPDHFSKLNMDELKSKATEWMNSFDSIQEISLYKANSKTHGETYIIAATVPTLPKIERELLDSKDPAKGYKPIPMKYHPLFDYYNWCNGCCNFTSIFSPLKKNKFYDAENKTNKTEVDSFYRKESEANSEDWLWITIPPNTENGENDLLNYHVRPETKTILIRSTQVHQKAKKLRQDQKDKIECQNIAKEIWEQHPELDIIHLIKRECSKFCVKVSDSNFTSDASGSKSQIREWASEQPHRRI